MPLPHSSFEDVVRVIGSCWPVDGVLRELSGHLDGQKASDHQLETIAPCWGTFPKPPQTVHQPSITFPDRRYINCVRQLHQGDQAQVQVEIPAPLESNYNTWQRIQTESSFDDHDLHGSYSDANNIQQPC